MTKLNVLFGAGTFWQTYAEWLIHIFNIQLICDSDTNKWGNIINGVKCISIDELTELKMANIYIGIEDQNKQKDVQSMLAKKGLITSEFSDSKICEKQFYVWGSLYECRIYDWLITHNTNYRIAGYVTHLVEKIGFDNINHKPIISLFRAEDELLSGKIDGIIALTDSLSFDGVSRKILSEKLLLHERYYIAPYHYLEKYKKDFKAKFKIDDLLVNYSEKNRLGVLQFMITAHCNLNCRLCSHFAGLVEAKEIYTYEQFCKDIEWAGQNFEVDCIDLWGGEVLLVKNLEKYVYKARECFPDSKIDIGTNGLMIKRMSAELITALQETNARLVISMYPPTLQMIDDIVSFLQKKQIKWIKAGNEIIIDKFWRRYCTLGDNDPNISYRFCTSKYCPTIYNGIMSACYFPIVSKFYNLKYGMCFKTDQDLIYIHQTKLSSEEIMNKLRTPLESCRYCGPLQNEEWGRVTTSDRSNWIYT